MDEPERSRMQAADRAAESNHAPLAAAAARARTIGAVRTAVLVEGASDAAAVETLAMRRGRDLAAEHVVVVPTGGAHSIGHFLALFGPHGLDVGLAGLCDAAEEGDFRRGLEQAGLQPAPTRDGMEALGFFVCDADLEDELIRCLGADAVQRVIETQGELVSWHSFQRQPYQRGRTVEAQLRRFMGTRSGRKMLYARSLVEALDLTCVPRPLDRLLARV